MAVTGRSHRVELDFRNGDEVTVTVAEDETVLSAARAVDAGLPFGCRTGACATCTGKLLDGDLEHVRPPRGLKDRHLDSGYVLLCIAEPRSDCRIEVGASVANDLVSNPWK